MSFGRDPDQQLAWFNHLQSASIKSIKSIDFFKFKTVRKFILKLCWKLGADLHEHETYNDPHLECDLVYC